VQRGEWPEALVDRTVARVQACKSRLHYLLHDVATPPTLACVGSAEHQALAASVVEQSAQRATRGDLHGD
jgi:hypothetical protein